MAGERINQTLRNNIIDAINFNNGEVFTLHVENKKFCKLTVSGWPGIVCTIENGDVKTVTFDPGKEYPIVHEDESEQGVLIMNVNSKEFRFRSNLVARLNDGEIIFGIFRWDGKIITPGIKNMKVTIVQDAEEPAAE